MNLNDKLLTETESSALAGVGIDTLNKYSEIGLLETKVKDNQKFYYENDIKTLFYAQQRVKSQREAAAVQKQPAEPLKTQELKINGTPTESVSSPKTQEANPCEVLEESKPEQATKNENIIIEVSANTQTNTQTNLPSSIELIELNKGLREQIQYLREERDWLRERIEKLETRSEREQMLLLSESENLRNVIKASKRGFWERALPWFGNK